MASSYDVAVVGAGPSGLAAAIKCRELGYDVLVLEKRRFGRVKSCAGLTPEVTVDVIETELSLQVPEGLFAQPSHVGLYLVGPESRGVVGGYRLANLNRPLFDSWLSVKAEKRGVDVRYMVADLDLRRVGEGFELRARLNGGKVVRILTRYVVGADGAASRMRRLCYQGWKPNAIRVAQEMWVCDGDFGEYFYMMLLDQEVTPTYGYVVPKAESIYLVGVGVFPWQNGLTATYLSRFKRWLSRNMGFKPVRLVHRDAGLIPFDKPVVGRGNIILIGDAAGFTNSFTGEGIRPAIDSGITAAEAVKVADGGAGGLAEVYGEMVDTHLKVAEKSRDLVPTSLEGREEFVAERVTRIF